MINLVSGCCEKPFTQKSKLDGQRYPQACDNKIHDPQQVLWCNRTQLKLESHWFLRQQISTLCQEKYNIQKSFTFLVSKIGLAALFAQLVSILKAKLWKVVVKCKIECVTFMFFKYFILFAMRIWCCYDTRNSVFFLISVATIVKETYFFNKIMQHINPSFLKQKTGIKQIKTNKKRVANLHFPPQCLWGVGSGSRVKRQQKLVFSFLLEFFIKLSRFDLFDVLHFLNLPDGQFGFRT